MPECCVFRLVPEGLELIEVAPGIDIERDILPNLDFKPIIRDPVLMDARIFQPEPTGLRDEITKLPLEARFGYDAEHNLLFLNFEGLEIKTADTVARLKKHIRDIVGPLGHKVHAVVNYENAVLDRDVEDLYLQAVSERGENHFLGLTRFTTSAFMLAKLRDSLEQRGVAPHIFESLEEAQAAARNMGASGLSCICSEVRKFRPWHLNSSASPVPWRLN